MLSIIAVIMKQKKNYKKVNIQGLGYLECVICSGFRWGLTPKSRLTIFGWSQGMHISYVIKQADINTRVMPIVLDIVHTNKNIQ